MKPENQPCGGKWRRRLYQAIGGAALLGIFPACYYLSATLMRDVLPICFFRTITGKPCPLCGMTRALALACRGDWKTATQMNPLWPAACSLMLAMALALMFDSLTGCTYSNRFGRSLSVRWRLILGGLLGFGVFRLLGGWGFAG